MHWNFVLGKSLSGCGVLQKTVCWNFVLGKSLLGSAWGPLWARRGAGAEPGAEPGAAQIQAGRGSGICVGMLSGASGEIKKVHENDGTHD